MSGVERVQYMDNQRSAIISETIAKEKKLQRQYFEEQEAAGRIKPYHPTKSVSTESSVQRIQVPEFVHNVKLAPEQCMADSLSRNMWTSNPGYIIRNGTTLTSLTKSDYDWKQEEIEKMKHFGEFQKQHNRRKDEFTDYMEAAAKSRMLSKH